MNIIQKPTTNFDTGRNGVTIDRIVCHWIVGDLPAADAVFANPASGVSAHYAVGTSEIHQYVNEADTAWHAGKYAVNQRSIGIEHRGGPNLAIDDGTYKNSAELIASIAIRYGIPLDRVHILKHNEVVATACPGTLDLDRLISTASQILQPVDPCAEIKKQLLDTQEELKGVRESRDKWKRQVTEDADKYAKDLAVKQEHIESLQETQSEMNLQITNLNTNVKSLTEQNEALKAGFEPLEAKLKAVEDRLVKVDKTVVDLSKSLALTQQKLDEAKAKITQRLSQFTWLEFIKAKLGW